MCRNVNLKNSVYNRLKQEKGKMSFSEIIEQYMNKTPVAQTVKNELQAASPTQNEGMTHE